MMKLDHESWELAVDVIHDEGDQSPLNMSSTPFNLRSISKSMGDGLQATNNHQLCLLHSINDIYI
jgi:hypothetical protein